MRRLVQSDAAKFVAVGAVSTSFNFAVLVLMVEVFAVNKVFSSGFAYISGGVISYLMNYYLTFKSTQAHVDTLPKFIVVVSIGAAVNTLVFKLVMLLLPIYVFAQCVAVGVALVVNYLLHKFWIYRADHLKGDL